MPILSVEYSSFQFAAEGSALAKNPKYVHVTLIIFILHFFASKFTVGRQVEINIKLYTAL